MGCGVRLPILKVKCDRFLVWVVECDRLCMKVDERAMSVLKSALAQLTVGIAFSAFILQVRSQLWV